MTKTTLNQKERKGVGYFDTIFSGIDIETIAEALKDFALTNEITEEHTQGEVLNSFVSSLIKTVDIQSFQQVAPQLFTYPKQYQGTLEVSSLTVSEEELDYLKKNIDQLLQEEIEVI